MRQSFSYALLITWIFIAVSCKTQFVQKSYETKNISVTENVNELDDDIVAIYKPFKEILDKDMHRVISKSNAEMVKDRPESLLTNFLADLLLEEGIKNCRQLDVGFIPDVAIINYGSIRVPIPKGEITVGNIFELMPFENEMVYLKLSGEKMKELISFLIQEEENSIAGLRVKIKDGIPTEIKIGSEPFNPTKSYWIVTSDYLAEGGDDFVVFKSRVDFVQSGVKMRDAFISYLENLYEQGKIISAKLDGRITYE